MSDKDRIAQSDPGSTGQISEPQSHTEHQAALDATLFSVSDESDELVLELDAGKLRLSASS